MVLWNPRRPHSSTQMVLFQWCFYIVCPRHAKYIPKIGPRYPQDMVGIGKSGVWQYGLLGLVEPCSNKKPEASYTDCPNCQHLWRTLYEPLWTFYEPFLREMSKFYDFPQNAKGLVCFPPFSFLSSPSSSKYEPLFKSIIFLYSP